MQPFSNDKWVAALCHDAKEHVMQGTINERTNGRFTVVTAPLWDASEGKKRRRSLGTFDTEEEAERVLARHRADVAEGVFSLPAAEVRATRLQDYLGEWLDLIREQELLGEFKRRTVRDYEATVRNNIQPYIGDKRIGDLTVPLQRRWLLDLRATGLGDRTVQKAHRTLHRALADSGLPENPAKLPKSARPVVRTRKRIVRPTVEEVAAFLDHVRGCSSPTGSVLAPLWQLAAATGLRRSELCGLGWDLVDLDADQPTISIQRTLHRDAGEFLIQNPKSEAGTRAIGIDEATVRHLRAHRAAQAALRLQGGTRYQHEPLGVDLVFRGDRLGSPLNPDRVTRAFKQEWTHAGLQPGVTLHGLRHGHGSALLLARQPVPWVAARLGHRPDVLLSVYADELDPASRQQQLADLAGALYG